MMSIDADDARDRADAKRRKAQEVARERESARAAYEAQAQATRENIVRLRAMRLAKEAAEKKSKARKAAAARRKAST